MPELQIIYKFDSTTKEFIGTEVVKPLPLGGYTSYPPNHKSKTHTPPPEQLAGHVRCWINGEWVQVEDNRYTIVYSTETGEHKEILDLGPIPEGYTKLSWPGPEYIWSGEDWVKAPVDLKEYAAEKRWEKEVGGVTLNGFPIATDDRSKAMIIGARMAADADENWVTMWAGSDGSIQQVDREAIIYISNLVQNHVNSCFTAYANIISDIDSGDITSTEDIDAVFANL